MKYHFQLVVVYCLAILLALTTAPACAQAARFKKAQSSMHKKAHRYKNGELLIKFKKGTSVCTEDAINKKIHARRAKRLNRIGVERVTIPAGMTVEDAIKFYKRYREVEFVEPNYICSASVVPNDTFYGLQWGPPTINAPAAWDITTGAAGAIIAVIDTGVNYNHEDLTGKVILGYDYVNSDNDPADDHGHGTHVAGIAAAVGNNAKGVAGISWGSQILAVKVLDNNGDGLVDWAADGITYAADQGAKVINLSLGSAGGALTFTNAIQYARAKGCIVIAAAGNKGDQGNPVHYPAACQNVIGVAATDDADLHPAFSNHDYYVDVSAPGVDVASTYFDTDTPGLNNVYAYMNGTSMATPFVSGLAALLVTRYPAKSADQIAWIIQESPHDLGPAGWDENFGLGRIDALAALNLDTNELGEANAGLSYTVFGTARYRRMPARAPTK